MKKNIKLVPYSQYKTKTFQARNITQQHMAKKYYISKELKEKIKEDKKESKQNTLEDSKHNTQTNLQSTKIDEKIKRIKVRNSRSNYYKATISPTLSKSSFSKSSLDFKILQNEKTTRLDDELKKQENLFQGEKRKTNVTIKTTPTIRTIRTARTTPINKDTKANPKLTKTKLLQKAEQLARENGETGSLSLQSGVSVTHGKIKAVNTTDSIIKTYYVAKNFTSKTNKIKSAKIDETSQRIINLKKRQIYKNYQLKDLISDRISERNKRVQYDINKTTDTSTEAIKFTRQNLSDIDDVKKSVTHAAKQTIEIYKFKEKQKAKINEKINDSRFKNTRIAKTLDKSYKKDQARKKLIHDYYKKSQVRKNIQRFNNIKVNISLAKSKAISFIAIKIGLPLLAIFMIFVLFGFISAALTNSANGYMAIGAEKNVILDYQKYVSTLDSDLEKEVQKMAEDESGNYDDVVIDIYGENGHIDTNFKEILVLNTVFFEQSITFAPEEQTKMNEYHKKLNPVSRKTERYKCSGCRTRHCSSENCSGHRYCPGHTRLRIIVNSKSMEDIIDNIGFNDFQKDWSRQLMLFDLELLYPGMNFEVEGGITGWSGMTNEEIINILKNLPESGATRDNIVDTAVSLVGKVPYFWGGKSGPGWNNLWNTPQKVTAPGTSDSGTTIPYGLDCSGFVDWVYKTSGATNILGKGGTAYQWNQSYGIDKKTALPGDLVFKNPPNSGGINHIGIYIGKDSNGKDLFVHCAYGKGVTIDSWSGFKYYRRVKVKLD